MKNKGSRLMCLVLALLMLSGCQLAREDGANQNQDRLIGAFLTWEYLDLFDHDAFMEDHMDDIVRGKTVQADGSQYQGRLYATRLENGDFAFEGVDGMNFFIPTWSDEQGNSCTGLSIDPGVSEGHQHILVNDEGENVSIQGTIYVAPSTKDRCLYTNPVYQTAEGDVYAMAGSGMGFASTVGEFSQKTEATSTTTDEEGRVLTQGFSMEMTVKEMAAHRLTRILQLNGDHQIVASDEWTPGHYPEELHPVPDCAYILVENLDDEGARRMLYEKGDEVIKLYTLREDSVMVGSYVTIVWPEE